MSNQSRSKPLTGSQRKWGSMSDKYLDRGIGPISGRRIGPGKRKPMTPVDVPAPKPKAKKIGVR